MKVLIPKENKVALDIKDWKILNALVQDQRQSISKIAKKCLLSRQSVDYRIKQMNNNGLITGYRTVINIQKLGYSSYHAFVNVVKSEDENKLIKKCIDSKDVNALITYKGKYSYEISIMAKTPQEFYNKYQELVRGINISDSTPMQILKTVTAKILPQKFMKQIESKETKFSSKKEQQYNVDKIDIKLMNLLSKDATISNIQLASILKISKDSVAYRIKKLISSNHIINFRPAVNYNSLNLSIETVLLKVNPNKEKCQELEIFMNGNESILWAAKTFGEFDYIIYILSKDLSEFHETFNSIKGRFEDILKEYELLFAYSQEKYSFMAECIGEE